MSMEWLIVMPEIPLARSVPVVVDEDLEERAIVLEADDVLADLEWPDAQGDYGITESKFVDDIRVDLEDSQGFLYAARWACLNAPIDIGDLAVRSLVSRVLRLEDGPTPDMVDRLAHICRRFAWAKRRRLKQPKGPGWGFKHVR